MTLQTLRPAGDWNPNAHGEAVRRLGAIPADARVLVWCDDGCVDCQVLLPAFAGALDAAGIDDDRIVQYAVERLPEGRKRGPSVEAYDIEHIPTVVVERDGTELARFVEGDPTPIVDALVRQLGDQ